MKSLYKLVEFVENLGLTKIEGFSFRHIGDFLFSGLVGLFVLTVELDTAAKNLDDLCGVSFPYVFDFGTGRNDLFLAVLDHLICDFDKQTSHLIRGVIEPGDGVDHLDRVHQRREGFNNLLWGSGV